MDNGNQWQCAEHYLALILSEQFQGKPETWILVAPVLTPGAMNECGHLRPRHPADILMCKNKHQEGHHEWILSEP